jgi:tryptophan synthase alpha chain
LEAFVNRVRAVARQPLCVGFGISTPRQAREISKMANGVIVGSRIIQLMESREGHLRPLQDFVTELRQALNKP